MKILSHTLLGFALTSAAVFAGCAVETTPGDSAPADDRGNAAGKADDPEDLDCEGAALDEAGVCRNDLGQFAPKACCADELACQNATIDEGGKCRDQESGQFVPAACCDALCEGAQIINGFCRNADTGQFMLSACCADQCFALEPTPVEEFGSCEGSCGGQSPDGCFCDDICAEQGDCCADAAELCPEDVVAENTDAANSCADSCGGAAPSGLCFCDEVCAEFGDCCGDKVAHCGGEGTDDVVACQVDECEGAEVDENFVCRKPGGEFAMAACCGLDKCDNADLQQTDEGQLVCRDDESGQFVPMVCCEQRCGDASLDRNGICRMGTGQFADPSCCADECFQAQERGRADALDACNGG